MAWQGKGRWCGKGRRQAEKVVKSVGGQTRIEFNGIGYTVQGCGQVVRGGRRVTVRRCVVW